MKRKAPLKGIALNRSHLCLAVRRVMLLCEIAVMALILVFVWDRFYNDAMPVPIYRRGYYPLAVFYAGILFICLKALKGRGFGDARLFDIIVSQILALLLTNMLFYFPLSLLSYRILEPRYLILMTLGQALLIVPFCFFFNRLFFYFFRPLEVLLISDTPDSTALSGKIGHYFDQFRIVQTLPADADRADLRRALKNCQGVLLETRDRRVQEWLTMQCFTKNLFLFVVPDVQDIIINCAKRFNLVDTPMLSTASHRISTSDLLLKRCMDIALSLFGIAITLPLWLLIALAIRLDDGGPVFFRQQRLTLDGKRFRLIKFRTMIVNAEREGQRLASENDKRITRVGAFLRKTRLDELPQLWNILRGDMSLVGPRPECPAIAAAYGKELPEFAFRLKVKAGLTGMAQVYGNYDTSPRDKCLMDIMYIEDYSLSLDCKLLLLTLRTLFLTYKTNGVPEVEEDTAEDESALSFDPNEDPFEAGELAEELAELPPVPYAPAEEEENGEQLVLELSEEETLSAPAEERDISDERAARRFLAAVEKEKREGGVRV